VDATSVTFVARNGCLVTHAGILLLFKQEQLATSKEFFFFFSKIPITVLITLLCIKSSVTFPFDGYVF